jgi:hypothetical protein
LFHHFLSFLLPFIQIEFEKARNEFYKSYDNAPNEIKKSAIFIESRVHTCEFEKKHGRDFTDWSGVIDEIRTDQGGDEIESFKIKSESQGRTIYYEEFGIKKGTSLYNEIAEFKEGDNIYFTFKFNEEVASTNEKECFDENSLTEFGSIEEPEFSVSFSNIKK